MPFKQEKIKTLWSLATSDGEECDVEAFLSKETFLSIMVGSENLLGGDPAVEYTSPFCSAFVAPLLCTADAQLMIHSCFPCSASTRRPTVVSTHASYEDDRVVLANAKTSAVYETYRNVFHEPVLPPAPVLAPYASRASP